MTKGTGIVKIDLKDWEWGNWPQLILNAFKIEKDYSSLEISLTLDDETVVPIVKQIITEGLQAILESWESHMKFTEGGLLFTSDELSRDILVPWKSIWAKDRAAINALKSETARWEEEITSEEEEDAAEDGAIK